MAWPRVAGLRPFELGTPGPMRARLNELVLTARKRAMAGLLSWDYQPHDEAVEHVGEHLALLDDDGRSLATLRVTAVDVVPFAQVSDDFAAAEGEGFTGAADWAEHHRAYWTRLGATVEDTSLIACVRFELVG